MGRRTHCPDPVTASMLMLGQIPIQLAEMSPPAFRATFPGVAYQLGNVCIISQDSQ